MIDWSATGAMLTGIGTTLGAGAVVYAARKGTDTFEAYRKQKQEERRIDAAERILTLAYTIKRSLEAVRSPMSTGNDQYHADEQLKQADWYNDLNENEKRKAQTGQIILQRLVKNKDTWDQIFTAMPIARALFGEAAEGLLQKLWEQVVAVSVSAEMYRDDQDHEPEFRRKLEHDFWSVGKADEERNPVLLHIEEAIGELEGIMLPVIRADYRE